MKVVLLLVLFVVLLFAWMTYPWELAPKIEPGKIGKLETVTDVTGRPTTLTLLSWNIAYAYGIGSEGSLDYAPREEGHFRQNLTQIAEAIKFSGADVVLLQEIDFGSSRSHGIDELSELARLTGLGHWAQAESWRTRYVPFPFWPLNFHFGRMSSGGAVLSRYPIVSNEVHLLQKPLSKAWWYNLFYLYRYFQVVKVKVGERELSVLNLHLEAFDQQTKEAQAHDLVKLASSEGLDFIGGDFNMVPEGAIKRSGFRNPLDRYENDKTYTILKQLPMQEVVDLGRYLMKEETWFTFPSDRPDRRLDYIYYRKTWPVMSAEVMTGAHAPASDHLPLKAVFKFLEPEFIRD